MTYGETVTRIRGEEVGQDRYGDPIVEDVETTLPDLAGFDPGGSVEPVEVGRAAVITTPKLYFWECKPDLRRDDRVRVRGEVYEIAAEPAVWENMFTGWQAGTVVELTRTGG